jgi:hypothetical protein
MTLYYINMAIRLIILLLVFQLPIAAQKKQLNLLPENQFFRLIETLQPDLKSSNYQPYKLHSKLDTLITKSEINSDRLSEILSPNLALESPPAKIKSNQQKNNVEKPLIIKKRTWSLSHKRFKTNSILKIVFWIRLNALFDTPLLLTLNFLNI